MTNAATSFAALVSTARRLADMTAAEFDYSLTTDGGGAFGPYGYLGLAASQLTGSPEAGKALLVENSDNIAAMVEAAKTKSYTGWSRYSTGPIRYAANA